MARNRRQQVDPFNAGDPIMPWDQGSEYVPVGGGSRRPDAAPDGNAPAYDSPVSANHDEPWGGGFEGSQHTNDARRPKTARTPKGKAPKGKKPASKTAKTAAAHTLEDERARSRRRSRRGMFTVKLIVILAILGFLTPLAQCAMGPSAPQIRINTNDDGDSANSSSSDVDPAKIMEDQQLQEITNRLSSVQDDAALVQQAGAKLDQDFQMYTDGIAMQQAGIDPTELARWVLTSATYDPSTSNSYAYEDGGNEYEGRVYLDVSTANTVDIPYDLGTFVHRDLLGYQPLPADGLTADQKAQVATKLEEIKAKGNTSDSSLSFDFEGTWDPTSQKITTTMDEDEWSEQVIELFGIYED